LLCSYQFAITIGIFLAACVSQGTKDRTDSGAYRIPIAIQFLWALILGTGLFILPESPRYFVKKGMTDRAIAALCRIRGQPAESEYIQAELAEIQANYEYEMTVARSRWSDCFRGGLKPSGNLYRVLIGTGLQMFQQLTGVNFIFYYGNTYVHLPRVHHDAFADLVSVLQVLPAVRYQELLHDYHCHLDR
jgi:SP family sugar:H+ symporter-like MFS transporter